MAWKRGSENAVTLPDGRKAGQIAKIELYGTGKRADTDIRRRLLSFTMGVEEVVKQRVNEKGEEVSDVKKRFALDGGAGISGGVVTFPAMEGWPHEDWTGITIIAIGTDGDEAELAKLDVT
jgi:hypothetical protein